MSGEVRLSAAQVKLLATLGRKDGLEYRADGPEHMSARVLARHGLAERTEPYGWEVYYRITPAGRAWLERNKEKQDGEATETR